MISALGELEPAKTLHILVNNSGVSWGAPFHAVPEDRGWDNIMAVNVKSLFYREHLPPSYYPHSAMPVLIPIPSVCGVRSYTFMICEMKD